MRKWMDLIICLFFQNPFCNISFNSSYGTFAGPLHAFLHIIQSRMNMGNWLLVQNNESKESRGQQMEESFTYCSGVIEAQFESAS